MCAFAVIIVGAINADVSLLIVTGFAIPKYLETLPLSTTLVPWNLDDVTNRIKWVSCPRRVFHFTFSATNFNPNPFPTESHKNLNIRFANFFFGSLIERVKKATKKKYISNLSCLKPFLPSAFCIFDEIVNCSYTDSILSSVCSPYFVYFSAVGARQRVGPIKSVSCGTNRGRSPKIENSQVGKHLERCKGQTHWATGTGHLHIWRL